MGTYTKKIEIEVTTEVSTIMEIEIPINEEGSVGCQIEDYLEEYEDEIAEDAKERLFHNMQSDWRENLYIRTRED